MCLKPIKIRNPAKMYALSGGAPLYLNVPCGQCAECKENKRKEWSFRSFHQVNECISCGGYVYYVTLTYADEHLPHISDYLELNGVADFSCFCVEHWRNFLKLLRIRLHRMYNGATLKYFLSSEYGTDEQYTHRPHYHLLLFIYLNGVEIDPYKLSLLVSACWKYGRTDGLPYKPRSYVKEHVYGYDLGQNNAFDFMKACSYVSKYITKDSTFQHEIDKRVSLLKKHYDEDTLKPIIRNIDMFHRQSQGFGLSYIDNLSYDEYNFIKNNGACRLYKDTEVVSTIALPLYYTRKLFYKCLKFQDKYVWQPTAQGCEYIFNKLLRNVDNQVKRLYMTLYNNDVDYDYIQRILGGRTLFDFVVYKTFYQGRFAPSRQVLDYTKHEWLNIIVGSTRVHSMSFYERATIDDDYKKVFSPLPSSLYSYDTDTFDYDIYIKQKAIFQGSESLFSRFDELDFYLSSLSLPLNAQKQSTFDYLEDLTKKFKFLYYGCIETIN